MVAVLNTNICDLAENNFNIALFAPDWGIAPFLPKNLKIFKKKIPLTFNQIISPSDKEKSRSKTQFNQKLYHYTFFGLR